MWFLWILAQQFHVVLIDSWQSYAKCLNIFIIVWHWCTNRQLKRTIYKKSVTSSFRQTQTFTFSYTYMLLHRHAGTCQGEKLYERQTEVRKCLKHDKFPALLTLSSNWKAFHVGTPITSTHAVMHVPKHTHPHKLRGRERCDFKSPLFYSLEQKAKVWAEVISALGYRPANTHILTRRKSHTKSH